MESGTIKKILLIGLPNCGKSSLFNLLTGKLRKVSNYSGITVDSGLGELLSNKKNEEKVALIDLPGISGVIPNSLDEAVTLATLGSSSGKYQGLVLLLDAQRMELSLSLLTQLKDWIGPNFVCLVNKVDNKEIFNDESCFKFEQEYGIRIRTFSTLKDEGSLVDEFIRSSTQLGFNGPSKKLRIINRLGQFFSKSEQEHFILLNDSHEEELLKEMEEHHVRARNYLAKSNSLNNKDQLSSLRIDKFLIHPVWGSLAFITIFYLLFHAIYSWSAPFMDGIEWGVSWLGDKAGALLPEGMVKSLVVDGIFAGVGGVVVFLPQIVILFFLLALLELSGYVARAAFLTDKLMAIFGLSGKSFLPYLSGFACAVPAIMSARTIPNRFERMATIMTIPLITCSARLPVYALLIGTFIPTGNVFGVFNQQALAFFFLYFLGGISALLIAKVLRLSYFKGQGSGFAIDFPQYQIPSMKTAWKHSWRQGKIFLKKAGTVILGFSILFWIGSNFPRTGEDKLIGLSEEQQAAVVLENSAIGRVGHIMEPILKPIGMDWKIGVGVLVAYGARELFVSAMGTIYSLGDVDEESTSLRDMLKSQVNPDNGKPIYGMGTVWAILLFFVFSLQCTSTLAIAHRESGSLWVPLWMFTYMTILGYGAAFVAYRVLG